MRELYSGQEKKKMGDRAVRSGVAVVLLLALAVEACVILCARVNTRNTQQMFFRVVTVFTLAGWGAIGLFRFMYRPSLAEYRHIKGIREAKEEETCEGVLTVSPDAIRIPRSVVIRKAMIDTGEETRVFSVNERYLRQMPKNGARVRVKTVRKYITAVEACDE